MGENGTVPSCCGGAVVCCCCRFVVVVVLLVGLLAEGGIQAALCMSVVTKTSRKNEQNCIIIPEKSTYPLVLYNAPSIVYTYIIGAIWYVILCLYALYY